MAKSKTNSKTNMGVWVGVGIIAVLLLIVAGVLIYNYFTPAATLQVSESQSKIEVSKGQQFTISLSSNATTGYVWSVDDTYDKNIVTKVSDEYITSNSNLTGAGGTEKWTFKAQSTGTTTLNFRYIRPWEGNSSQANSVSYTVTVK